MQLLYVVFGALCVLAGVYEMAKVSIVVGAPSVVFGIIVISLSSIVERVKTLEIALENMRDASPRASNRVVTMKAEPVASTPTREPTADEVEAAKALLAKAQDHHFAKRFAQARALYQQIIDDYGVTKQAATARQQLVNLRDA